MGRRLRHLGTLALAALALWSVTPALLLAQIEASDVEAAAAETGPRNSYVMAYMLVALSVGLGVFIVCRSSRRASEVKFDG